MENIYLTQKAQKTQRDFLTTNETIFLDNGLNGLDGCLFNNELNELNEIFSHAARRSMTRSTFGATNDTNLQFGVANGISPRKSAFRLAFVKFVAACGFVKYISVHMVMNIRLIREIRC